MTERTSPIARRIWSASVLLTLAAVIALALPFSEPTVWDADATTAPSNIRTPVHPIAAPAPLLRAPVPSRAEAARVLAEGRASYYGPGLEGNPTANGEAFDPGALTAAHRTLPFGTRVRVTNLRTGDAVVVRINDRGPFHGNRIIDLSREAARRIGLLKRGTGQVRLELLADDERLVRARGTDTGA